MGASLVFLPVEIASRELDSRLMIASHLSQKGIQCLIGPPSLCSAIARRVGGGLYLHNRMTEGDVPLFKSLVEKNVRVVAIDDEILNASAFPDTFRGDIFRSLNIEHLDAVFCSTPQEFTAMVDLLPNEEEKIWLVGNPRIEVLSPPFRTYHQSCLPNWQEEHNYVLIATNFVSANMARSYGMDPITQAKRIFASSNFRPEIVEKLLADGLDIVNWEQNAMKSYIDAIRQLLTAYPEIPFVVRPHPSEEMATWKNLLASHRNVTISKTGSAANWLVSARLLIHAGSTVALEANEMGIPTVYLMPATEAADPLRATTSLPRYYGPICHTYDDLKETLSRMFSQTVLLDEEFRPSYLQLNAGPSAKIASVMANIVRNTAAAPRISPYPATLAIISSLWEVLQLVRTWIGRVRIFFGSATDAGSSLEKFGFEHSAGIKRRFSALSLIFFHQDSQGPANISVLGPRTFLIIPTRPSQPDDDISKFEGGKFA